MKDLQSVKEAILNTVRLEDILVSMGRISGGMAEEQLSCPFHGVDRKKSARYYAETDTAYCWVCTEKWDLFSFVAKKEGMSFAEAIAYLVKTYRVRTEHLPEATEGVLLRHRTRTSSKVQPKTVYVEKLKAAIVAIRDEVVLEKYRSLVFGYMYLKYRTPDEKIQESAETLRASILKVIGQ